MIFPFGIPICQYRICVYYIPISAVFQQQCREARISPKNPENKRRRADFFCFFPRNFSFVITTYFRLKIVQYSQNRKPKKSISAAFSVRNYNSICAQTRRCSHEAWETPSSATEGVKLAGNRIPSVRLRLPAPSKRELKEDTLPPSVREVARPARRRELPREASRPAGPHPDRQVRKK